MESEKTVFTATISLDCPYDGGEANEISICEDEYYGGHWLITHHRSYYFTAGTSLEFVFNILTDERL